MLGCLEPCGYIEGLVLTLGHFLGKAIAKAHFESFPVLKQVVSYISLHFLFICVWEEGHRP